MERLPLDQREILIRYGRLAPHARDRILDQFYLLVPGSSSLQRYLAVQGATVVFGFIAIGLASIVIAGLFMRIFYSQAIDVAAKIPAFIIMFQGVVALFIVFKRRRRYRKRYHGQAKVTEIGLTESGLNVHGRIIHGGKVKRSMRWDEINYLDLIEDTEGPVLLLGDDSNKPLKLHLDYIQTIEERHILRNFIYTFVKQVDTRTVLTNLLRMGKPQDIPFTKLWCQALTDSRPRVHTQALEPGTTLQDGNFTIKECIGGGGQGIVYAASMKDLEGSHDIVLKEYVLPDVDHVAEHKAACEQFEKEIRLLGKVNHELVIKLIDAFVEDHRAYLVLEHVDGLSLREHVARHGPMNTAEVVEVGEQMCDVLTHLHTLTPSIMHLDFSPDNILIASTRKIVLIDFNISVEENSFRTRTVMGKQRYMAPEQYRGKPTTLSDVYSLGASFYYLITGCEPEPISVARPSRVLANVSKELDALIVATTALEESERPQSAEAVKRLLEQVPITHDSNRQPPKQTSSEKVS